MNINEKTWQYIHENRDSDVRTLALRGTKDAGVDVTMALQQIAGWQTARRKLPAWAAVDGIVYPPHLNMEQCSSEQTARYKAALVQRFFPDGPSRGRFVDLTGGLGVDFFYMSQGFAERTYVEQNAELCSISSENFRCLDFPCSVVCGTAAAFLSTLAKVDLIYLDPARRDQHGGRTYGIEDCTPNVVELLPSLIEKAERVMLKLSPMLDWHQAVERLKFVDEVHIVSVDNECKELLLVLSRSATKNLRLVCVNNGDIFECAAEHTKFPAGYTKCAAEHTKSAAAHARGVQPQMASDGVQAGFCLYEPNASIMKAGCFDALTECFAVVPVAVNSHLFLSADEIDGFPGRRFRIVSVSSMNKKELTHMLSSLSSANISVRNFPMTAEQLRKKLKLKDGGDVYIFATTLSDGSRRLLICRKIG